jgi:hypothetical protein
LIGAAFAMNLPTHASPLLLALIPMAFAVLVAVVRWQARLERADAGKPFQQEWEESGWRSLHRGQFQLCRIIPVREWPKAEFSFEDEHRAELGRLRARSRKAAVLEYGGKQAEEILQRGLLIGKLSAGSSKGSIVIRDASQLIAEASFEVGLSRTLVHLLWQQQEFLIEKRRWPVRGTSFVRRHEELIGVFRRTGGLSRKTLFALRSDLPEELKVFLCSLAVLN